MSNQPHGSDLHDPIFKVHRHPLKAIKSIANGLTSSGACRNPSERRWDARAWRCATRFVPLLCLSLLLILSRHAPWTGHHDCVLHCITGSSGICSPIVGHLTLLRSSRLLLPTFSSVGAHIVTGCRLADARPRPRLRCAAIRPELVGAANAFALDVVMGRPRGCR